MSPFTDYQCTIKEFDDAIGLDRLKMLHVNDSVKGLGSRVDRHAALGQGAIGMEGLQHILSDKRFDGLPMILETPKGTSPGGEEWDAINMRELRRLASLRS